MSPIRTSELARYPPNWPEIRARIQRRAGNRCEDCGIENWKLGGRLHDGTFLPAIPEEHMQRLRWPAPGTYSICALGTLSAVLRIIRIVCTCAHLDSTPENCKDSNLRFLCQRCHLRLDAPMHRQHAYETRRKDKAIDMFQKEVNNGN
jgi:hypothetical protein